MILPRPITLLRGATLPDGSRVDVAISDDIVTAVSPAGTLELGDPTITADPHSTVDLDGYVLLTATADPHAHLDKARSWDAIQPPLGDLMSAIGAWRDYTAVMTEDEVVDRQVDLTSASSAYDKNAGPKLGSRVNGFRWFRCDGGLGGRLRRDGGLGGRLG